MNHHNLNARTRDADHSVGVSKMVGGGSQSRRDSQTAAHQLTSPNSSPPGRGSGEGAPHEQTIAGNVAEILEA